MDAYEYLASIETRIADAGFTMAAVCRKAGMSQSLVSKWRALSFEPRLSSLNRLDRALNEMLAAQPDDSIENIL